jgi:hypothetical protein
MGPHSLQGKTPLAALLISLLIATASSLVARPTYAKWRPHQIKQADGRGGWITRPARIQTLKHPGGENTKPFGMAQMDNGEIIFIGSWHNGTKEVPVVTISSDGGDTWSALLAIPGQSGRPMMLTYLGGGNLSVITGSRLFSSDYGRTWPESVPVPPTSDGLGFYSEGNAAIDRDANGMATKVIESGCHFKPGKSHPIDDGTALIRHSTDGGRTWQGEVAPSAWKFTTLREGKPHVRGITEGSLVRAVNGWLVAALRTDITSALLAGPHNDNLCGTAISISKDDGRTWSPLNILFTAGRHHAQLHRLSDGMLVCVMIVRNDWRDGRLAGHLGGCDALVSYDHGVSWNLDRRITLDEFEYYNPDTPVSGRSGHIGSAVLDDGSILTAYGNYPRAAAVLVKWKPDVQPAQALKPSGSAP